jgi:pyroglutamyl-peptidase
MKTVLLTGFEPFGGEAVNPSALAVRALSGRTVARHRVLAAELPCAFATALPALRAALRRAEPALVICVGQAGGRASFGIERVAINVADARIADNAGARPIDTPIAPRGPVGYWSTLPIKSIVDALRAAGLPAEVSQTAGTFVCNQVFYGLMRALRRAPGVRGGFIHVPYLPEQAAREGKGAPCLALEKIVAGLELAVATALTTTRDARTAGGAEH